MKEMKLTAYHKYLLNQIQNIKEKEKEHALASLIYNDIYLNQNPQAFDLLEETGDKKYSIPETFVKAAKLLIEAEKNEKNK